MVFSSFTFLLFFLPVVMIFYYLPFGITYKNAILLIASLIFYGMGEPIYILLLLGSSIVNYFMGIWISRSEYAKGILAADVLMNLLLLILFKYTGLTTTMPVGISFYTFQAISYVVDVYRNPKMVQTNCFKLMLYISFFPQLIAGPIVKYHDINAQLEHRNADLGQITVGLRRFVIGLAKKVLLANTLGLIVDQAYSFGNSEINGVIAWTAAIFYCLQIYYDFSGYSDMAIGLAAMFGIGLKENFNHPYAATSIKDFWRRWHISLSAWFKEYLYIPLGGNRKGKMRTYLNKYLVFLCTGLWHGASINFVIWGLIHGTFSVIEENKWFSKHICGKLVGWIYSMFVVTLAFVFFRAEGLSQATCFLKNMFVGWDSNQVAMANFLRYMNPMSLVVIVCAMIGVFDWTKFVKRSKKWQVIGYGFSVICLILCVMTLGSQNYNPFIYYRF